MVTCQASVGASLTDLIGCVPSYHVIMVFGFGDQLALDLLCSKGWPSLNQGTGKMGRAIKRFERMNSVRGDDGLVQCFCKNWRGAVDLTEQPRILILLRKKRRLVLAVADLSD